MNRISIWMTETVVTITGEASVLDACKTMTEENVGSVVVVNGAKPIGIFTERDLMNRVTARNLMPAQVKVNEVMTGDIISVTSDTKVDAVYNLMKRTRIRHVVVIDNECLKGILSIKDLFNYRERALEDEVSDLSKEVIMKRDLLESTSDGRMKKLLALSEKLGELALKDELTGLYNYRYFMARLKQEVHRSQRYKHELSLIFCDIDHFKMYNDTYGHLQGDQVLKTVASILTADSSGATLVAQLRKSDLVARYGGEEFVILLTDTKKDSAAATAERLRKVIEEHPFSGRETQPGGHLTMSMGVAALFSDAQNETELIETADEALYAAKQSGRNRVCGYMTPVGVP